MHLTDEVRDGLIKDNNILSILASHTRKPRKLRLGTASESPSTDLLGRTTSYLRVLIETPAELATSDERASELSCRLFFEGRCPVRKPLAAAGPRNFSHSS